MKLWQADLTIPFGYSGDALSTGSSIKALIENGWYYRNNFIGMPTGQLMYDFPGADNFHFLLIKVISLFTSDYASVLNFFFLLQEGLHMHILLLGSSGMLGHALTAALSQQHKITGLDLPDLDITNISAVQSFVFSHCPDLLINAAAYTDVDGCESNIDHAFAVNATGPRNLAVVCNELDIPLIHISTDYIFDGNSSEPYKESDNPNPQSVYGKSKLLGEQYVRELTNKHYIIRTSWLYGQNGKNFVDTMLRLAGERDEISVVNDQVGSPTYTVDLAQAISELITEPAYGTYHLTNSGTCSWYEFTLEIFKQAGITGVRVKPITTEELNRPAPRPKYSVLDNSKWIASGRPPLRPYQDALKEYLTAIQRTKE